MSNSWKDIRYALRGILHSPGFAAVVVLSLGLGIGANTAIFTLINAVFLQPLPIKDASHVISVFTTDPRNPGFQQISYPNYIDYRDRNTVFSGLAASTQFPIALATDAQPIQIFGEFATGNFFDVLGVKAYRGRTFTKEEDGAPGAHPVVVLGHAFWTRQYGADTNILGQTILLNGHPFTVIGVGPPNFKGTNAIAGPALWVPYAMYEQLSPWAQYFNERRFLWLNVAGRLKPGVSEEQALSSLQALARHLEQAYPDANQNRGAKTLPLTQSVIDPNGRQDIVSAGSMLMTIVGLVLLIACANIANLLLARSSSRRKEIAVRLSMGASTSRLIRQLLTESVVLSLLGGVLGLLIATWGRSVLWSFRPPFLQNADLDLSLDTRVLLFTLAISLVTGIIFGLAPAIQSVRSNLVVDLRERSSQSAQGSRRFGVRNILVVAQVALSLVALVGAGLFLKSAQAARQTNPGFAAAKIGELDLSPGTQGYSPKRAQEFYRALLDRVQSIQGVESASITSSLPLGVRGGFQRSIFLEGQDPTPGNRGVLVLVNVIGPRYFETMGIPALQGRMFNATDREGSIHVAVANETFAKKFWGGQDVIGKRFRFFGDTFFTEVVGVVKDNKYNAIGEPPTPCVFQPSDQEYQPEMTLVYRSVGQPDAVLGTVRRQVQSLDHNLLITNVTTLSELIDQSLWAPRMGAGLLAVFGVLALLLSAVGLYGVMAYSVTQRTSEIGIRMALGARRGTVFALVMGNGLALVAAGIVLGLIASFALARLITNLLFSVEANDFETFAFTSLILAAVATLASYFPAWRATRIDPIVALRAE